MAESILLQKRTKSGSLGRGEANQSCGKFLWENLAGNLVGNLVGNAVGNLVGNAA